MLNFKLGFKNNNLLIISIIVIISYCLGSYFSNLQPLSLEDLVKFNPKISNQDRLDVFSLLFALVGGLWVFLSYLKLKKKEQNDFVKISLTATKIKQNVYLKTKIDNPVNVKKKIKFAFLVLSKTENGFENSGFIKKINTLYNRKDIYLTNDLIKLFDSEKKISNDIGLIPLPYYYKENYRVGNEELSCTFILTKEDRNKMENGFYEVRFFVFSNEEHLHRSVQDAFYLFSSLKSTEKSGIKEENRDSKFDKKNNSHNKNY